MKRSFRKFIRKHHPLRKDVIDMIYALAEIYDDRAEVNIAKCEECDKHKQVYAYFYAEGKTWRRVSKDLRELINSIQVM